MFARIEICVRTRIYARATHAKKINFLPCFRRGEKFRSSLGFHWVNDRLYFVKNTFRQPKWMKNQEKILQVSWILKKTNMKINNKIKRYNKQKYEIEIVWTRRGLDFNFKKFKLLLRGFITFALWKNIFFLICINWNFKCVFLETDFFKSTRHTEKIVSLNQRNISLIYGQRKNSFKSKKVLLIRKNFLWSKEIDLFILKKVFLNQQNFPQFKEIFSLTVYQRNVSLN